MYRQYELQSHESVLICWLKVDQRVKLGVEITLKQLPGIRWTVTQEYSRNDLPTPPQNRWEVGGL